MENSKGNVQRLHFTPKNVQGSGVKGGEKFSEKALASQARAGMQLGVDANTPTTFEVEYAYHFKRNRY